MNLASTVGFVVSFGSLLKPHSCQDAMRDRPQRRINDFLRILTG